MEERRKEGMKGGRKKLRNKKKTNEEGKKGENEKG